MTNEEIAKLFEGAPEGATHYSAVNDMFYIFSGQASGKYWSSSRQDWTCAGTIGEYSHMIPRPSSPPWNGEGLPPVGVVCEYSPFRESWHPVKVFALKPNGNGSTSALFEREKGWGACADPKCFRPIRPPEQIAADEREAAIKEACAVVGCAVGSLYGEVVAKVVSYMRDKQPTKQDGE